MLPLAANFDTLKLLLELLTKIWFKNQIYLGNRKSEPILWQLTWRIDINSFLWIYVKYASLLSWLHLIILKCKPYRPSLVSYFQHHREWQYKIPRNSCWLIFKIKEANCTFMIPLFVPYHYSKLSFSSIWFPSNPTHYSTSEWIHMQDLSIPYSPTCDNVILREGSKAHLPFEPIPYFPPKKFCLVISHLLDIVLV